MGVTSARPFAEELDLTISNGTPIVMEVLNSGVFQGWIELGDGAWDGAVVEFQWSPGGEFWESFDPAETFSANGKTAYHGIETAVFVRAIVTTASSTANSTARIAMSAWAENGG